VTAQATSAPQSVRTGFVPAAPAPIHPPPRPRVSVVIPALDEEQNIGWVLRRMPDSVDEVIVVDGLSRDATIEVARMILPQVVIVHEMNPGKGNALRAGFEAATGDVVVMIDADGSMDPADIPSFLDAIAAGHDVAKGSRFASSVAGSDDISRLRMWGNAGLLLVANLLYRTRHTDLCYGFVAFRKDALRVIRADASGFEIEMQLVARATRARLRVIEVANHEHARMNGTSNLRTVRDGWRVLMTLLGELRWRPTEDRMTIEEPATLR
jgi:glycosyltransferase involved in cell wall biosynthesis